MLRSLRVTDFRNLARVEAEFPAAGVAVVGDNGQGKSNLLEAIAYLHALRSVRGARDVDLVRFGTAGFHVSAVCDGGEHDVASVGFERGSRRKRPVLDGVAPPRLSDALGALPSVTFSPRDVELVTGAPASRRRFLDVLLALTSRRYLEALQDYRAALVRRNATLRTQARAADVHARLAAWEGPLATAGAVLWMARREWVLEQRESFRTTASAIGDEEPYDLRYVTSRDSGDQVREEDDAVALLHAHYERTRTVDVQRRMTTVGPHRDDLDVRLGGRSLRTFGSAGQQRTAAIALRLLECETLASRGGRMPVLLLDDPLAELDPGRSRRVLDRLTHGLVPAGGQTILAVPRPSDIPAEWAGLSRWRMSAGTLSTEEAHGNA